MRYAIVANGKVVNVAEAQEGWTDPLAGSITIPSDIAMIGWAFDGSTIVAPPPPAIDLIAYAKGAQAKVLAKGQTFTIDDKPILCDGLVSTRADLTMLALYAQATPNGSKTWIDNDGTATVLSSPELIALATNVGNWIADTYPALADILSQIKSGTITTLAQIDAFAWPTS